MAPNLNYTFSDLEINRYSTEKYYLPNVNIWGHQHNNALPDMSHHLEEGDNTLSGFSTSEGHIVRTPEEDPSVEVSLGEYFKENINLKPLLPFEGDTIVEGRFGNSIRFGSTTKEAKDKTAYSTTGNTGDPITIFRNGQHIEEDDNGWEHTIENINKDHSSIYLTSNQVLPNMNIVSLHWQSWMAKHDELKVKGENDFDDITKGAEVEAIEPEKPTEQDDQNLKNATAEEIAAEENANDEAECEEEPMGEIYPEGNTIPSPKYKDFPPYDPIESTSNTDELDLTPPPYDSVPSPTTNTIPPDILWSLTDFEEYRGFMIQRGYKRTDGEERSQFYVKEPSTPPQAGSLEEYIHEDVSDSWTFSGQKDNLDYSIKSYEDGDRL